MSSTEETAAAEEGIEADESQSGSEETEVEFPSFNIELPADLAAELEEDDPDLSVSDEELDELAAEHEDVSREVLARMRAAEKKSEHLEKLRVNDAKKNWAEEAKKFFPLAEPYVDKINATSRRGFLRTAKELHESYLPLWERTVEQAKAAQAGEKEKAAAEGKQEAKKAWGSPAEDGGVPSEATVTLADAGRRRGRRELSDTIREMMFSKES